jgi:hypothetical protein
MSGTMMRIKTTAATMPIMAEGDQPSEEEDVCRSVAGGAWGIEVVESRIASMMFLNWGAEIGAIAVVVFVYTSQTKNSVQGIYVYARE